jgi:hypothetical protein
MADARLLPLPVPVNCQRSWQRGQPIGGHGTNGRKSVRVRLARKLLTQEGMKKTASWLLMSLLVGACSGGPASGDRTDQDLPVLRSKGLDILFVIDTSSSMAQEQASLVQNFDRFMAVLGDLPGASSLHIGVVSTDLGAGPHGISGCDEQGQGGVLQSTPRVPDCPAPQDAFLREVRRLDGTVERNFEGELAEAFSCIARLGAEGCGFEQPLEAMYRALDGSNPGNAGFLRETAHLAVVFITDEDDCSVFDDSLFAGAQDWEVDLMEPLSAMLCFESGVRCSPDTPGEPGVKTDCQPRQDSSHVHGVTRYVDFLKGLKADPDMVMVAGITGPAGPVEVIAGAGDGAELAPSCQSATSTALPPVRLAAFLDQFPQRSTHAPICDENLEDALVVVAQSMAEVLSYPCLQGALHDTDGDPSNGVQPECLVSEVDQVSGTSTALPACNDPVTPGNAPCYVLEQDATCEESGLSIHTIYDELEPALASVYLNVRCRI